MKENDIKEAIENLMYDYFYGYFKQQSLANNTFASGRLISETSIDVTLENNVYHVSLNMPEYWKYAEYGRSPGKLPPIQRIKDWVYVKKGLPVAPRIEEQDRFAWAVAHNIAKYGTEGNRMIERTMRDYKLSSKLNKIVGEQLIELFTTSLQKKQ